MEIKFIKYPQDIFNLDGRKLKIDGWGKLSVQNLKYSIEQKYFFRKIYIFSGYTYRFRKRKIAVKHFVSFSKFKNLSNQIDYEDMINIDGIGDTQVSQLRVFFQMK